MRINKPKRGFDESEYQQPSQTFTMVWSKKI